MQLTDAVKTIMTINKARNIKYLDSIKMSETNLQQNYKIIRETFTINDIQ